MLNLNKQALEAQLNEKTFLMNKMDHNLGEVQNNMMLANKDLQYKLSRHDTLLTKIESDHMNMMSVMKDLQAQFLETQRALQMRMSDIEMRTGELNGKCDMIISEQNLVIKNVEGDTVKQLQLLDSKTRSVGISLIYFRSIFRIRSLDLKPFW
jgi:hypothetical protein